MNATNNITTHETNEEFNPIDALLETFQGEIIITDDTVKGMSEMMKQVLLEVKVA